MNPKKYRQSLRRAKAAHRQVIRLERRYYLLIREEYRAWWAEMIDMLSKALNIKLDGPLDFLNELFDAFSAKWGERVARLSRQVRALGQDINTIVAGYFAEELGPESFVINPFANNAALTNMMDQFAIENARLIKNIGEQTVNQVSRLTMNALTQGTSNQTLAKQIKAVSKEFGENRTKLIARDQVSKLSGQLTAQRAKDAGSDSYIWQTVGDSRVRKSHQVLNGKERKWTQSPIPGEEIQCRCFSVPIF